MPLIDRNHEPTLKELRLFGVLFAAFCCLLGGLWLYQTGSWAIAVAIWMVGVLMSILYYSVPAAQGMVFRAWMTAVFPIAWLLSHTLLAVIYYGVITPIGLALRLWDRDPLNEKWESSASTYWTAYPTYTHIKRYFQQF